MPTIDINKIPITIGITGHRQLSNETCTALSAALNDFFCQLHKAYPNSPLILISALAEGADRIAAKAALDNNAYLYAALPMQAEEYKKDFGTTNSISEFEYLLYMASKTLVMPCVDENSIRPRCYAEAGNWMVTHCDILLALWDGEVTGLKGGTGETVLLSLGGDAGHNQTTSTTLVKPVMHYYTSREGDSTEHADADLWIYDEINMPDDSGSQQTEPMSYIFGVVMDDKYRVENLTDKRLRFWPTENIEEHNKSSGSGVANAYPLIPDDKLADCDDSLKYIHQLYVESDRDALAFQNSFNLHAKLFYSFSAIGMICMLLFFRAIPNSIMLISYAVFFLLTSYVAYQLKNKHIQQKYLFSRTLSEISRIYFYSRIFAIHTNEADDHFSNKQTLKYIYRKMNNLGLWILHTLYKSELFMPECAQRQLDNGDELVEKHWIKDQFEYFERAYKRNEDQCRKYQNIQNILFILSLLLSIVIAVKLHLFPAGEDATIKVAAVVIAILAGLGGIVKTYSYTMGFSEVRKQSAAMKKLFRVPAEVKDRKLLKSYIHELFLDAIMETIEWFTLRNERPVKPQKMKKRAQLISRNLKNIPDELS